MHQQKELAGALNVQAEPTDLLYVNSKDFIQNGKILIRVASLFLKSFRHLSVLDGDRLISSINIYHFFHKLPIYHVVFSPVCQRAGISSLEAKYEVIRKGDEGTWQKHLA